MGLVTLAQGYLEAEGYTVNARGRGLLIGRREAMGDEQELVYLWVLPDTSRENFATQERPYLRRFMEAADENPTAMKYCLAPTLGGLSTDFRRDAQRHARVAVRAPAQFFDTDFKWEKDPRAASATRRLKRRGEEVAKARIAQPFQVIQSPGGFREDGSDLLAALHKRLRSDSGPTLHVVIGPAGMGKSVLFESLFSHLQDDFQNDKRARLLSARPFALLPEHSDSTTARTVGSLLDAYLQTEPARPLRRDVFEYRLLNGMAMWLLDGLDEILERDHNFFDEYLMDIRTRPSGTKPPKVVICVRDSLFATHEGLREFCEDFKEDAVVWELAKWRASEKRDYARRSLGAKANSFIGELSAQPVLNGLASTPFYCRLLTDEFAGSFEGNFSEQWLLDRAIDRIIEREHGKGLLAPVGVDDVRDFIEAVAAEDLSSRFRGVSVSTASDLAHVVLPDELHDEDEIERFLTQMTQVPTFKRGADDGGPLGSYGTLRFAQESLEHYLVANYLVKQFRDRDRSGAFFNDISSCDLPQDVTRFVAEQLIDLEPAESTVSRLSARMAEQSTVGRNALGIAVQLANGTGLLKRAGVRLEGMNLSRLQFVRHDLSGVSFDGSDLTNTTFDSCDLSRASFDGCLFKGTVFENPVCSSETSFGNFLRFYSASFDGKFTDNVEEVQHIVRELTSEHEFHASPCAAALQLRHLFNKFVTPAGDPRRSWLDRRGVLSGKVFMKPEAVLDEAIHAGYLSKDPGRERINRVQGDRGMYSELHGFATRLEITPGIRSLLDEVCSEGDCQHVP